MYKIVFLLVFCSISTGICEHANIYVIINYIKHGDAVECKSKNPEEFLLNGEKAQLVTNLPENIGNIKYSWCVANNRSKVFDKCNQTENRCISSELTTFTSTLQGQWQCYYYINSSRLLQPRKKYVGQNFTLATCAINFTASDKIWFTGLNPNRRTVKETADESGLVFKYIYEYGESLNISCQSSPEYEIVDIIYQDKKMSKTTFYPNQMPFVRVADDDLHEAELLCRTQLRQKPGTIDKKIRLDLLSRTAVTPTTPPIPILPSSTSTRRTTSPPSTTKTPIPGSRGSPELQLKITESLKTQEVKYHHYETKDTATMTYTFSFNEPKEIFIKCIFNIDNVILEILDGVDTVVKNTENVKSNPVSYNFTLNSNKTITCRAREDTKNAPNNFKIVVHWIYNEPITDKPQVLVSTTKAPETATETGKYEDGGLSLIKRYWVIIVICCTFFIIMCIVAGLVKMLWSRKKSPPPDDYVNLTSDRQNDCPSQTVPNRSIPKVQTNYCDPKDIKGPKSNIEPNYSQAKEPQTAGEGLYAELNRPEDTYAEPYINKNELYAQPIPKAQRPKKDDPNYGNVFGQEYVNSKK